LQTQKLDKDQFPRLRLSRSKETKEAGLAFFKGGARRAQVTEIIFLSKEARLAIVATLHDVQGYSI
jgi:hypothetical protein